jgi:hypothetical protein
VDIDAPPTSISRDNVYNSDQTAISVLNGIFTEISQGFHKSYALYTGLSSDELTLWVGVTDPVIKAYYENHLSPQANAGTQLWTFLRIYKCNEAIERLRMANKLTDRVRKQLLGEALFTRSHENLFLLNLYGEIPLIQTTDYTINAFISRSPETKIYEQIITDLVEAKTLLSKDYLNGNLSPYNAASIERVRPTYWAATALLARVYLYSKQFSKAEIEAKEVIDNTNQFGLVPLSNTFLKNNKEAIWQLQPVMADRNTEEARIFILPPTGPSDLQFGQGYPVYLSTNILDAFESNDGRKKAWIDSVVVTTPSPVTKYYYPAKYKNAATGGALTEYTTPLRLAEILLIHAEALAELNKISEALEALNKIRNRANLPSLSGLNKEQTIDAIVAERKVELFTEAHRWFDMKRRMIIDQVMSTVTPSKANGRQWESYQKLYPIPLADIVANPNLVQNKGYE